MVVKQSKSRETAFLKDEKQKGGREQLIGLGSCTIITGNILFGLGWLCFSN